MTEMTPEQIARLNALASTNTNLSDGCPECGLPWYEDDDRIITTECVCGWSKK